MDRIEYAKSNLEAAMIILEQQNPDIEQAISEIKHAMYHLRR